MRREQIHNIKPSESKKRLCLIFMIMLFVFGSEAFSKDWNGIVPCVSTRSDSEKILGKDDLPNNISIYKYKKSRVHVRYRENKNDPDKDVVEKIDVYPDKSVLLAKYIKNIPNFQKDFLKTALDDKITHVYGRAVYRNWTEGFEIWVQKNEDDLEVITTFGYFDRKYSCSKILPDPQELKKNNL